MATVKTQVTGSYQIVNNTGVDGLIQNVGTSRVHIKFDTSTPSDSDTNAHTLERGQAIQVVSGVPSGNAYVKMVDSGKGGYVAVSN